MPSPEKSYSAGGYRVFIQGPVHRIKEDLNERSKEDPIPNETTEKNRGRCQKRTHFQPIRTELCSLFKTALLLANRHKMQ